MPNTPGGRQVRQDTVLQIELSAQRKLVKESLGGGTGVLLQEEGANQSKGWVEDREQGKWRNALNGCDPLAMHWGASPRGTGTEHSTPRQIRSLLLVQAYFFNASTMAPSRVPFRALSKDAAAGEIPIDSWPYLDEEVLLSSSSRQVCITCHWFSHHAGVNCIPLLTCQLHEGLISHGDHLTHRCPRWTQDLAAQRGWAPEAA